MAIAKKCDRCGKLFEQYPCSEVQQENNYINGIATVAITENRSFYNVDLVDLCPDCLIELKKWMDRYINKPSDSVIQTNVNEKIDPNEIKIIDSDDVQEDPDVNIVIEHPNMLNEEEK